MADDPDHGPEGHVREHGDRQRRGQAAAAGGGAVRGVGGPAVAHPRTAPLAQRSQPTRLSGKWVITTAPTTPNDTTTSPMIKATIRSRRVRNLADDNRDDAPTRPPARAADGAPARHADRRPRGRRVRQGRSGLGATKPSGVPSAGATGRRDGVIAPDAGRTAFGERYGIQGSTRYRYAPWLDVRPGRSRARARGPRPRTRRHPGRRRAARRRHPQGRRRSWSCSASKAGPMPGTSWPRCCGPSRTTNRARSALRRTLSVLRSALGGRWVIVDRSAVALDGDGVHVDLADLEAAAASGDHAELRRAASLARGPFLAGFSLRDSPDFDDWRATRAVAVERLVGDVLERLATTAEAAGDMSGADRRRVSPARPRSARRTGPAPADGPARTGRRPGRCHPPVPGAGSPSSSASWASRRWRRRRTCTRRSGTPSCPRRRRRPAPISPAAAADEPAAAAATDVAALPVRPARLPIVGRDAELAALVAAHHAASPGGRVAVLTGEAGIGKSRLAEALAESISASGGRVLAARAFAAEGDDRVRPDRRAAPRRLRRPGRRSRAGRPDAADAARDRAARRPATGGRPRPPCRTADAGRDDQPAARARLLDAIATVLVAARRRRRSRAWSSSRTSSGRTTRRARPSCSSSVASRIARSSSC